MNYGLVDDPLIKGAGIRANQAAGEFGLLPWPSVHVVALGWEGKKENEGVGGP